MATKMFRNCPYADINISCEHCIKYETCKRRKSEQKNSPKRKTIPKYAYAIFIVAVVVLSNICSLAANNDEQVQQTIQIQEEIKNCVENQEHETTQKEVAVTNLVAKNEIIVIVNEPVKEEVVKAMISAYEPGEVYYYHLTMEEKILIAKVVYAESRGEPFEGKVAVAAVVLNRYVSNDPVFDTKSIEHVVRQSGAFASINWITNSHLDTIPECMEAVEAACKGWDPTRVMFEDGAKYFYSPASISAAQMALREGVPTLKLYNHNFHNEFNQ